MVAVATPSDAFDTTIEAVRIALKYMTPVILLSDNHIANGSEPWKLPDVSDLPDISVPFATHHRRATGTSSPTCVIPRHLPGHGPSREPRAWSTGWVGWRRKR